MHCAAKYSAYLSLKGNKSSGYDKFRVNVGRGVYNEIQKAFVFYFPTIFQWRCFSWTTRNSQNYTYFQKRETNRFNNIVKSVSLSFLKIGVILAIFSCFSKVYTEKNT